MTTFDSSQVRELADKINLRLDQCENGEGMECNHLDETLACFADGCCQFATQLRAWSRDVFSGRVAFDAETEAEWKASLIRMFNRGVKIHQSGVQSESLCFMLDGRVKLGNALYELQRLIHPWLTPRLSVGPAHRMAESFDDADVAAARDALAHLPPLPADWRPVDDRQAARLKAVPQR